MSGGALSLATSFTQFSDVIANRNLNFRVSAPDVDTNAALTRIVARPTTNANSASNAKLRMLTGPLRAISRSMQAINKKASPFVTGSASTQLRAKVMDGRSARALNAY